jgi:hypothetical protein
LGKSRGEQESNGLHRNCSVKQMNEGSERKARTKKKELRMLRNKMKQVTDKAKKEYLEIIREEIIEFQRTGHFDLMYLNTKEPD